MGRFIRRHYRVLSILLGSTLLLCGGLFVVFYGRLQALTCTRLEPSKIVCTQQISWLKIIPLGPAQSIAPVSAASTEEHCYDYECQFNGVRLITPNDGLSLAPDFFNTSTAQETVDRINQFIEQSTARELIVNSINGFMAVLGLGCVALPFILLGALVLIFWR